MNKVMAGFRLLERRSPFTDLIGPIYSRSDPGLVLAIRGQEKHCNGRGFVHGGVLCTLADIAMGYNSALAAGTRSGFVTTNLSIDFVASAKARDWISVEVDVHKAGNSLIFANCFFFVDNQRIARASAVFYRPKSKAT